MRIAILSTALPLVLGALPRSLGTEGFPSLCGNCWCIFDPETESCPAFELGHYDVLEQPVTEAYASFKLVTPSEDLPKLQAEDGGECYPFTHVGPVEKFPRSELPQCQAPPITDLDGAVCSFKYPTPLNEDDSCCGREYELKTYESETAAVNDGAMVTHFGACGVCSTATDLAVIGSKMSKTGKALDSATIICVFTYVTNVYTLGRDPNAEFDALVDCFKNDVGYSDECALLWAYSSATTSTICLDDCSGSPDYNGPPPECELSNCLQCTENLQGEQFLVFAGRNNVNSGILQPIARPCDSFSSVLHEPCGKNLPEPSECKGTGTNGEPTQPPPSTAVHSFSSMEMIYTLLSVSLVMGVLHSAK